MTKHQTIDFNGLKILKKKRKIVIFGAGIVAKKFIKKFDSSEISFFLDNNKNLTGTEFNSFKVKNITELKNKKFNGETHALIDRIL